MIQLRVDPGKPPSKEAHGSRPNFRRKNSLQWSVEDVCRLIVKSIVVNKRSRGWRFKSLGERFVMRNLLSFQILLCTNAVTLVLVKDN